MKSIPLTKGLVTVVDDADYEWMTQWKWHSHWNGDRYYAARWINVGPNGAIEYMHRVLLNAVKLARVDHRDRDGLNNQRANLRLCTTSKNNQNSVGRGDRALPFKGVSTARNKYRMSIAANGKKLTVYGFLTPHEAALAYDQLALQWHGEFALTNKMMGLL